MSATNVSSEPHPEEAPDPELSEIRNHLVLAAQKSQEDYDKSVILLSGGALGVSFAFVKDIVGAGDVYASGYLVSSWTLWALSAAAVLASYFVSAQALRRAIRQCDDGSIRNCKTPGDHFTWLLRILNVLSGSLFIVGVVVMCAFVYLNTPKEKSDVRAQTVEPTHSSTSSASTAAQADQGDAAGPAGSRIRAAAHQAQVNGDVPTITLPVVRGQRIRLDTSTDAN